jgi:hypothetical protein
MFHDLDSTLAELLRRGLPPKLVEQVSISFATPDAQFPPAAVTLPAINLFLYEIQENRELRGAGDVFERQVDGRVLRAAAPVRVDCNYLVTAWPKAGVQQPEQDEHRLLGEVLRVLLRHREIPREALRGSLEGQPLPVRATVLLPTQQQARSEFWQALGGRPKAAFNYTVTIAFDVDAPEDVGAAATVVRS